MQNDPGGKEPSQPKNFLDKMLNRDTSNGKEGGTQKPGEEKPRPRVPSWVIGALIVALIGWYVYQYFLPGNDTTYTSVPYSVAVSQIEDGNVTEAEITQTSIQIDLDNEIYWNSERDVMVSSDDGGPVVATDALKATIPPIVQQNNQELIDLLAANDVVIKGRNAGSSLWTSLLFSFLPFLLFLGLLVFFGRQMTRGQQNVFGFGRSKARQHDPERPQVTFADVAGEEEAKRELTEVVDFLRNPAKYHQLGARLPRGVLLVGPPGTGKTLMAKSVAGEAGVPFFSISASEFVEMFVGVGASRVRDLFEKAKASSPAIVFIDEMDAVGRQRFAGLGGSNDEREQTLNQLLVEMDGFDTNQEVIVMAATNRPDVLDPALLRPGRFDRQVTIGLPDKQGREAILKIHTRGIPLAAEVDLVSLAGGTTGFSGADLANLVNEAALTAARRNKKLIETADFEDALDKVLLGTVRNAILNKRDREVVATHEAGHALVAHYTPGTDPLRKVSIVPRGRALGVAIQAPEEDRYNVSKRYIDGRLDTLLGGRAAEKVVFNEITTGAESDLKQATALARRMVGLWGMSDEVGPVYLGTGEEHVFLGREIVQDKAFSDATATRLDAAVRDIIEGAQERSITMIGKHRDKLDSLVKALLEKETLDAAEVMVLLGPRPVDPYRPATEQNDLEDPHGMADQAIGIVTNDTAG
ncbi:MAG: ATP-dependent zinc metalloprotease FtsH [Thermomicrobiales bacterium]|nr:ATP-dependent zinc metalloprotease FtsH [Thermomicrobiales bacterium]